MNVCRQHVWAVEVIIIEGKGKKEKEGGRNGFDEHQDYKAKYKGTGKPKTTTDPQERQQVTGAVL